MPERWLTYRSSDGSLYVDFYFAEYEDGSGWSARTAVVGGSISSARSTTVGIRIV